MMLSTDDSGLFYELNPALLTYANRKLNLLKGITTVEKFIGLALEEKIELRNALYGNMGILRSFIDENPNEFTKKELGIVESWKYFVRG